MSPLPLIVAPTTRLCGIFSTGIGFAGDHGFIHRAVAFEDHSVNRNLLAGPHPEPVADFDLIQRNVFFAAVSQDASSFRR